MRRSVVLYVGCGERKLQRGVQRFGLRGGAMRPLRAFGDAEARFGAPRGLCAWDEGVLVADTLHGVVQRFARDGRFIGHFATGRQPGESSRPIAVLALSREEVLVVEAGDEPGLRRFGLDGGVRPLPEPTATLPEPVDLARDEQGRVYVLYQDGERVVRLGADLCPDVDVFDFAEVLHG